MKPPISDLQWALLVFDSPVSCMQSNLVIGSRLDVDLHTKSCRLAFYGTLVSLLPSLQAEYVHRALQRCSCSAAVRVLFLVFSVSRLPKLRIVKWKERHGGVDRIATGASGDGSPVTVIGKGLFKKETDMSHFLGLPVHLDDGTVRVVRCGCVS